MAGQNIYAVFLKRGLQLLVVVLVGWFLPEIIFYAVEFNEAEKFEVKRYVMALFVGIYFVTVFRGLFTKVKW